MPVRMTETAISKAIREVANGTRRDLAGSGCPGLRLRLTSGGRATWVLACRDRHGRMRRFPLGRLNHASIRSPLAATYNRSRYRPQVAAALQRLADALDGIEAGGAEVVPLHAGT
jgi:hypothetical protein